VLILVGLFFGEFLLGRSEEKRLRRQPRRIKTFIREMDDE
jgi:uncharacterized protein YneF (UPF0154 family)